MQKIKQFFTKPKRIVQVSVAVIFGLVGAVWLVPSQAAGTATLTLSPASSSFSLGSTFTVTIIENSGTVGVNAVGVDLTYDQTKLQFVGINTSTSPFTLTAQATGGNGIVSIGSASTLPQTGQQTVAIVTFTALSTGSTNIAFANTSGIAQASDNINVLGTSTGATFTISDTSAPTVPAGLTRSNASATSISLSWTASTDNVGVTGYKVFRGGTQIATTAGTSYVNTGLTPSNTYSYTVAAYDAVGNTSSQTAPLSVSTTADTNAPTVPTGLTMPARTLTSISLAWTASTDNVGVTGYKIYRNGTQIGTSSTASYVNNGLAPGTAYSYTVAANDAAGNTSAQTAAGSFTTLADTTAPTVPSGLTLSAQTTSSLTVSWAASTDNVATTGYRVYRGGTQIATTAGTSYVVTGLSPGVAYAITVAAYDAAGNVSSQSATSSFTTLIKTGDANGDGTVDYLDLSILANTWQSTTDLRADFNNDRIVNYLDLSVLASKWGQ